MRPLHLEARRVAERFTSERLDRVGELAAAVAANRELREAAIDWIEHHTDRKLHTRELLETT
jgi:hypothetical protein